VSSEYTASRIARVFGVGRVWFVGDLRTDANNGKPYWYKHD